MQQIDIDKAMDFIAGHLKEEFSLEEIAQHCGYSAYHFARAFKAATAQSVMDAVRERRIHAAAADLAQGAGVCDVAMQYCFDTHAGFTRAFAALYGCSPTEYIQHARMRARKEWFMTKDAKIVIRPVCKDDVQDLWENVYSESGEAFLHFGFTKAFTSGGWDYLMLSV